MCRLTAARYMFPRYLGDVAAFDIATAQMVWQRSLNTGRADHMTITPDGASLFVSALKDNRVDELSASTGVVKGQLATGVYPHDNKVSKDGQRLYNSSLGPLGSLPRSGSAPPPTETAGYPFQLTVADVETLTVRDRIRLDNAFRPWQFAPDEKVIYAQLSNEHAVVAYDVASRKVIRRLDLPVKPGVTSVDWDFEAPHHGLALTDDGETLCLAGRASDYAALVRAQDLTLIATIPVGDAPGWAEDAEDGRVFDHEYSKRQPLDHLDPQSLRSRAAVDWQRSETHHRCTSSGSGDRGVQGAPLMWMTAPGRTTRKRDCFDPKDLAASKRDIPPSPPSSPPRDDGSCALQDPNVI